ncbi:MAG TPA: hypothetical protein VEY32_04215, partial [Flavisolibacter sp.]|nr:hypothetical protein [Flavisolibacter sp.]
KEADQNFILSSLVFFIGLIFYWILVMAINQLLQQNYIFRKANTSADLLYFKAEVFTPLFVHLRNYQLV